MTLVELKAIMKNQEVARIIDYWHFQAEYELHLSGMDLYRLDLQQPDKNAEHCSVLSLASEWLTVLEERQPLHTFEEAKEREQQEIECLRAFISQEMACPTELY